ncbi:MAG: DUF393 domain-containing protein [Acidobacteria bacterium]|nr:DUF393 domain-containing protein [Acidobacteriota bacterium]
MTSWRDQLRALRQGRWEVYYDGNCAFCRKWARRTQRICWSSVSWRDFRRHSHDVAHLKPDFARAAYLIIDRREAYPGFSGFRKLLLAMPPLWPLLLIVYLPGARRVGDALYRRISIRYGPVQSAK